MRDDGRRAGRHGRRARSRADEQSSSVSALLAQYVRTLTAEDAEFARLEALQEDVLRGVSACRGADRLDREALHDRGIR